MAKPITRSEATLSAMDALERALADREVTIYIEDDGRYCVSGGDDKGCVSAPVLSDALRALSYLGKGDSAVLGPKGELVCTMCKGSGLEDDDQCPECEGSARDNFPPPRWPKRGLPPTE